MRCTQIVQYWWHGTEQYLHVELTGVIFTVFGDGLSSLPSHKVAACDRLGLAYLLFLTKTSGYEVGAVNNCIPRWVYKVHASAM